MVNSLKCLLSLIVFVISIQNTSSQAIRVPFDLFKTTKDTIQINHFLNNDSNIVFESPSKFKKTTPNDIYWIRIDLNELKSQNPNDSVYYLSMATFSTASLFTLKNQTINEQHFGTFDIKDSRQMSIPVNLNQLFDDKYVYFKVRRLTNRVSISKLVIVVLDQKSNYYFQNYIPKSTKKDLITNYFFVGICMLIMFIASILYLIYRKTEYIFYTLNIACLMIYFGRHFSDFYISIFGSRTLENYYITILLEVLVYICYFQFIKYYLETKVVYPLFNKSLNWALTFLILISIGMYMSLFLGNFSFNLVLLDIRIVVITIYVLSSLIYLTIFRKTKTTYFVIIGSLSYFIGAILLYLFYENRFFIYSIIIEILIFGIGLGYKLKVEYNEKLKIQQLATDYYSSALRAQMNPHFIFNSLNSIQYLVLQKDTGKALKYLSKFSQLMRGTMENSINNNITLSEEIKLLKTYLEVESLRFNNSFTYQILIEEDLDTQSIEIPTLIIQPFIENAILHGLHHKKGDDKTLIISFKNHQEYLECIIEDNGIGRKAAQGLRNKNSYNQTKSRALDLTYKRLHSLLKNEEIKDLIVFEDLFDDKSEASGTRVIIKIPKT